MSTPALTIAPPSRAAASTYSEEGSADAINGVGRTACPYNAKSQDVAERFAAHWWGRGYDAAAPESATAGR
jgi:hypothetical protein